MYIFFFFFWKNLTPRWVQVQCCYVRPQRPYTLLGTGRALTRLVQVQCCFTCPQRPYGLLIRDVESNDSVGRTSVRYRFGSPFSSERLWFVDTVLWLCPSLPTKTLKWLSSLPIIMQESFWWWLTIGIISPSSPTSIVSVDVKHHVYLLTY